MKHTSLTELDLLIDLARIVKKHRLESFEELLALVRNQEFLNRLGNLLADLKEVRQKSGSASRNRNQLDILLSKYESQANFSAIREFGKAFQKREILPTLGLVNEFLDREKILHAGARLEQRKDGLAHLLDHIAKMSSESIARAIYDLSKLGRDSSHNSLESWSDIIIKK